MENTDNNISMSEFLSQFNLLNDFGVQHRHLKNPALLEEAKNLGYIKDWVPKNGPTSCTYYGTAICTLKGRLFIKNNLYNKLEFLRG